MHIELLVYSAFGTFPFSVANGTICNCINCNGCINSVLPITVIILIAYIN